MKLLIKKEINKEELKVNITLKEYGCIDKELLKEHGAPIINIKNGIYGAYISQSLECNFNRNPNYYIKVDNKIITLDENFELNYIINIEDIDRSDVDLNFSSSEKLAEAYSVIYIELIKLYILNELNKITKGA